MRVTRAALKRSAAAAAAAEAPAEQPARKKRSVLGEITNLSRNRIEKPKPSATTKKAKKIAVSGGADTASSSDQLMCGPYASDIYDYLHKMEVEAKRRPLPDYLDKVQRDVSANMRGVLVDWLVEVAEEYKLGSDTVYLSISYIDRFLSLNAVTRQRLQLLGVSSMLIAS